MMINGRIREAVLNELTRYSGARVEQGRLRRFEKEDFFDDNGNCHARVTINTFDILGEDNVDAPNVMDADNAFSGCCIQNRVTRLTISVVLPVDDASETELEAVEEHLWPLIAKVVLPDELTMDFVQSSLQPAQVKDSYPIASRSIEFLIPYSFDMSVPATGHRI